MKKFFFVFFALAIASTAFAQNVHQSELTKQPTSLSTVLADTSGWNAINKYTFLRVAADTSNNTRTTPRFVGGLESNLAATSTYEFEGSVQFTSAATTTGIILGFSFPSSPTYFSATYLIPVGVNGTSAGFIAQQTVTTDSVITTTVGATANTYTLKFWGKIVNVNAGALRLWYKSSVPTSAITIKNGSTMILRKVA